MPGTIDSESVSLRALVKYLRDAQACLEDEGFMHEALRFELFADYLSQDYKPKDGLRFKSIHIGL